MGRAPEGVEAVGDARELALGFVGPGLRAGEEREKEREEGFRDRGGGAGSRARGARRRRAALFIQQRRSSPALGGEATARRWGEGGARARGGDGDAHRHVSFSSLLGAPNRGVPEGRIGAGGVSDDETRVVATTTRIAVSTQAKLARGSFPAGSFLARVPARGEGRGKRPARARERRTSVDRGVARDRLADAGANVLPRERRDDLVRPRRNIREPVASRHHTTRFPRGRISRFS